MPQDLMRQWFVPGEGIDRYVISTDIQRYLGNDATVRPGVGTGEHQGVQGYWIKAYRNLTSAMITDLRADSLRWRQEQRTTGTRESYAGSNTFQVAAGRSSNIRRDGGDSPAVDGPYGLPSSRDRIPTDGRMQIDPPPAQTRGYQPPAGYPQENRPYQPERGYPPENRAAYPPENSLPPGYGHPATSPYGQDPRYSPNYQQPSDVPPGYVRQGAYLGSAPPGFDPNQMPPSRSELPQYAQGLYSQPQPGRDPRFPQQQPEYPEPRYAYPSPATTVASAPARDREPLPSSQQQPRFAERDRVPLPSIADQDSQYGAAPPQQYDQYGRPIPGPANGSKPTPARTSTFDGAAESTNGRVTRPPGRR